MSDAEPKDNEPGDLQTPLYDEHRSAGARMVPFAGYRMPVQYTGVVAEHQAVRNAAGLFDVCHMGQLWFRGSNALSAVDSLVTNSVSRLLVGRALYTVAVNEAGFVLDDLIVYRVAEQEVLVVCNAGNKTKMSTHFSGLDSDGCAFTDESDETGLIALQGPKAASIMGKASGQDFLGLGAFGLGRGKLNGLDVLVARTGYTGEDGFEIFTALKDTAALWRHLLDVGAAEGLVPAGLGARDTLRLEACLCLYGQELDEATNPYEAGLGWVVKLKRGDYLGRDALARIKAEGPSRRLVGLEMIERGIARHGYRIVDPAGEQIGVVTSGSPGPSVGKNIALGYVPSELSDAGTEVSIQVRRKVVKAVVVPTPFYKRPN